jgi:putative iron-dependent peroxidase
MIVTPPTEAAIFLVLTVDAGAEDDLRDVLADASGLRRSVGFRVPDGGLTCVIGVGAELWDRLFGAPRPAQLHPFAELVGPRHRAPATPGDLLLHIRAHRLDLCFELAQLMIDRLRPFAQVVDEVHGFKSFDERDLLGFVDGTENPEGAGAVDAVVIGEEEPLFAGGSYVVVQRYTHDLDSWNALPVEEQERVIGRHKLNDVELSDDEKPANAHNALTVIEDENGEEQEIVRFNMPFGRVGAQEFGTYFIGYARDAGVIERMLRNMFLGDPPGNDDRILDFSTAQTGNLFFAPSAAFLDDPPGLGEIADAAASASHNGNVDIERDRNGDGAPDSSLRIGGLRGGLL